MNIVHSRGAFDHDPAPIVEEVPFENGPTWLQKVATWALDCRSDWAERFKHIDEPVDLN